MRMPFSLGGAQRPSAGGGRLQSAIARLKAKRSGQAPEMGGGPMLQPRAPMGDGDADDKPQGGLLANVLGRRRAGRQPGAY